MLSLDAEHITQYHPWEGILWIHLDYSNPDAKNWILKHPNLDGISKSALLAEETRPRSHGTEDYLLLTLRGVNLNPGENPEDMVSLRSFISNNLIITSRKRKMLSIQDIFQALKENRGPRNSGEFLVDLCFRLTVRMENTIETAEEKIGDLEEETLNGVTSQIRDDLSQIRKKAILLRRYLHPQKEALWKILSEEMSWMSQKDNFRLREIVDQQTRYLEDLESIRERATVIADQISNQLADQLNNRMYVLSIIAAVFLPLGFLTGMLGINVGGIPGADNQWAFWIFCLILTLVVVGQLFLFRKKHWI